MTHSIAAQAVIDAAPLVKLGTCDVLGTMEQAALLAAGQVSLMSTKTGLSTILVDRNHDFAGHVGLSEMVRSPIAPDILLSGGKAPRVRLSALCGLVWPLSLQLSSWDRPGLGTSFISEGRTRPLPRTSGLRSSRFWPRPKR